MVNQGVDLFGPLVLVEPGATESRRKISTELTSLVTFPTGSVTVAKGAKTPDC